LYGGEEIFEGPLVLYAWCALNAAANVDCIGCYSCDAFADILFG